MVWKPNDVIRLVALVGGFLLFALGAWMLFEGISAEGVVDLKSTVLSGTLKTASAGLYICFFALFVIVAVLTGLITSNRETAGSHTRHDRLMRVFWGLLVTLMVCMAGAAFTGSIGFSFGIGVLLASLGSVVFAIIRD